MGKTLHIESATYGAPLGKHIDVKKYIEEQEYILSKTTDLNDLFGDPVPYQQKHVDVIYTISEDTTETFEEDSFVIKNGNRRIGFETQVPFAIDIENVYQYTVCAASLDIVSITVRPAQHANPEEHVQVPSDKWHFFVKQDNDSYWTVQGRVDFVEWLGEDPFPYREKVVQLQYRRVATYRVCVYEMDGYLFKDVYLPTELPLHRFHMLYHLFPNFEHHLVPLHRRYLEKCGRVFTKIILSIANQQEEDQEDNEEKARSLFLNSPRLEIIHNAQNPVTKESTSFEGLLRVSEKWPSEYTMFAHSKGFTEYRMSMLPNVASWTELSYVQLLMNMDTVLFHGSETAGCFQRKKTDNNHSSSWYYPGNFYWFKSSLVKQFLETVHEERKDYRSYDGRHDTTLSDMTTTFPSLASCNVSKSLDLLPSTSKIEDLRNSVCILQYRTLIKALAKDGMSRKAIGLL